MIVLPIMGAAGDEMMTLMGCGMLLLAPLLIGLMIVTSGAGRSQQDRITRRMRVLERRVQFLDQRIRELEQQAAEAQALTENMDGQAPSHLPGNGHGNGAPKPITAKVQPRV